jgi:hypothetical protein
MAQRGRRNTLEYAIAPIALKQIPTEIRKNEYQAGLQIAQFCSEVVEVFQSWVLPPVSDRVPPEKVRAAAPPSA